MKAIKSKKWYTAEASKRCRLCHTDAELSRKPVHGRLIKKAEAPPCAECHGSHYIKSISEWKRGMTETAYCLTCHKYGIKMQLKSGELLSLYVDESLIRKSVHRDLHCGACHSGFSKTEHPVRVFDSKRSYSIKTSDICKKCHADVYAKYEDSIHFIVLKEGSVGSPVCTDCHGFHLISKPEKALGLISCKGCHTDIDEAYKKSIHEIARAEGKEDVPVCSSCHNAHDVKVTAMTMKMNDKCFMCHKDAEDVHKRWLYNQPIRLSSFTKLHFDTVSCATCHCPDTERGLYLILYDNKTGKPFPAEDTFKLLGTDATGLMEKIDTDGDRSINGPELWKMVRMLNEKGVDVTFRGRLDVTKGTELHQLSAKERAVRECAQCHRADSEFFRKVSIVLLKTDGRPILFNAKQEVVGSLFTVLPVSEFYAVGATRVKLLDILFIVAIVGGVAVPVGHITLRIITSPIRRRRKK